MTSQPSEGSSPAIYQGLRDNLMINRIEHGAPYLIARCNCWIKGKHFILWLSLKHAQRRIEDLYQMQFHISGSRAVRELQLLP